MNKEELTAVLEHLGMRPGRGLGQNYLLDNNLLDFIVRAAAPQPGEIILEIGPGFGALTERLLATGAEIYAVEFDYRACRYLREKFAGKTNFYLTEGDGCKVDYTTILPTGKPFRAVANLPYAVSSVLIARFLTLEQPPASMIFLLQKEMGERLASLPGKGAYGALSVRVQQLYEVKLLRKVPPEVFYPAPAVDSALVGFTRNADTPLPDRESRKKLEKLVKCVFAARRKQMGKTLKAGYPSGIVPAALAAVDIEPSARPENLTVAQFEALAEALDAEALRHQDPV